jgi:hypothetical protein
MAVVDAIQDPAEESIEPEAGAATSGAPQAPASPRRQAPAAVPEVKAAAVKQAAEQQPAQDAPGEAPEDAENAETGLALKVVQQRWSQVLALVNANNPQAAALLRSGKLLGVKEGAVYIGLSSVLKERIEREENAKLVEEALQKVFQAELRLRCVISTGRAGSMPADVDSEGMVAAALRDLGGEIVDLR